MLVAWRRNTIWFYILCALIVWTAPSTVFADTSVGWDVSTDGDALFNADSTFGNAATDALTFTGEIRGGSPFVFEGATNDDIYTTFTMTDPTSARTITFPNASITVNAAADLSGTTLAANVVTSSLTSVGTLDALTISGTTTANGDLVLSGDAGEGLSGGGLVDCDTGASSKLLWDATTHKFSCGTDQNGGASLPIADTTSIAKGSIDDTKEVRFEVDGLTGGVVRVLTVPDADVTINAASDISGTTLAGNVASSSLTGVGTLNSGSITSGFGGIDIGTDTLSAGDLNLFGSLTFEGVTDDGFESLFAITDPTADRTITFQNASGTVAFLSDIAAASDTFQTFDVPSGTDPVSDTSTDTLVLATGSSNITITGNSGSDTITFDIADSYILNTGDTALGDYDFSSAVLTGGSPLVFEGATANSFETTFAMTDPTADRTITFPNLDITVNAAGDISGTTLAANVVNSSLTSVGTLSSLALGGNLALSTNSITTGSSTISSTELDRLDGKDAALVDTNDAVSTAITGLGTLDSLTVSGAIAANGGITFDNSTDTLGAHTLSGTLDANTNILTNIGNAGTDFTASGGLTLANSLTIGAGTAITKHLSGTATNMTSASIAASTCGTYGTITVTGAVVGDVVSASPDASSSANGIEDNNLSWSAVVTSADTVSIRACNPHTLTAVNTDNDQEWRADIWQH